MRELVFHLSIVVYASGDARIAQIGLLAPTQYELGRVGHEKPLFIYIFPIERQEFCQIPLVALAVWDLSQHVIHPGSWVNVCSLAGAYERIYDCCTIRRCVHCRRRAESSSHSSSL